MNDNLLNVLLVEDNPGDADLLQEILFEYEPAPFRVIWMEDLATGLEYLTTNEVDVLLLDLSLPDSSGLGTLTKALEHAPHVPIIVLTGLADEELATKAVRQGAQDYLPKGQIEHPLLTRSIRYAIERKQTEITLRENNRFIESLLENIPHTIFVKEAKELRFVRLNKAGENLLGYPREKIIGKNDYDFFPQEQAKSFQATDREALGSKKVLDIETETFLTQYQGTRIFHTKKIPIPDEAGKPRYLLGISEDITERKRAEERLQESEAKFRAIFQDSLDVILVIDSDNGKILSINPATQRTLGYEKDMVVGQHFSMLFPPAPGLSQRNFFKNLQAHGAVFESQEFLRADGSTCPMDLTATMIPWGQRQAILTTLRDITERKEAEAEILQRHRELLALQYAGATIASSLDINFVLKAVTREMVSLLDAEGCVVSEWQQDQKTISLIASYGLPDWQRKREIASIYKLDDSSAIRWVLKNHQALQLTISQPDIPPDELSYMKERNIKSLLMLPMEFQNRMVGLVEIEGIRREHTFSDSEIRLAQLLANQAAAAIENARLYKKAQQEIDERKQTQEHLQEERNFVAAILNTAGALVIVLDKQGRIVRYNRACEQTTGYTFDEVKGRRLWNIFILPEEVAEVKNLFQRLKGGADTIKHENHWRTKDGRRRLIAWSNSILMNSRGTVEHIISTGIDITERKQAERLLRSSKERFRQVVTSISDHIYMTWITPHEKPMNLYLSPNVEELTGYPLEEFMNDWRFWPEHVIHPQDRSIGATQAQQLAQGRKSEVEYRLVRADGQIIWVRDSGRVQEENDSQMIYGIVSDITERKKAELERQWLTNELQIINQTLDERVKARTAELQAILDAVDQGIVVTDLAGIIQYVNPALERLLGYSEKEALGQTPRLWKSGQQNSLFYKHMWETILSGQTWRGELINKHKDGTLIDVTLSITPIPDSDGQPRGFVGAQSDITPFKKMDRMKSEFLSTAAHELRTPLTSIQGFSEILLTRELDDQRRTHYLTYINQQGAALANIINDLLNLSRLEAGRGLEMNEVDIDLQEIVSEVLFGFQENNPRHQYEVIGPTKQLPLIRGDKTKLAQLFKNLFSNATKYSPYGGKITFKFAFQTTHNLLHLTLSDEGLGMTPEQLEHVFDRFYRADASNTAIGGTGLGMSISKLIIEQHRGKIWLESEYGKGTTVHIYLPLPDRPPYVLVIEDDEEWMNMQRIILKKEGFYVLAAYDGLSGLKLARTSLPDIILLDIIMPKMSGFEVLKELKASQLTQDIPTIITSSLDKPGDIEKAIDKGATDYLVKPYKIDDLRMRLKRALTQNSEKNQ